MGGEPSLLVSSRLARAAYYRKQTNKKVLTGLASVPSLGTTGNINVERGVEKWGQPAEPREGNVGDGRRKGEELGLPVFS